MIKIYPEYPISRLGRLLNILKYAYRNDIAISNENIFKWQYTKDRNDNCVNIIFAEYSDTIIGFYGFAPVDCMLFGTVKKCAFTQNWYVPEVYRGTVGWSLVRKAKKIFDGLFVVGVTEYALNIYNADKWLIGKMQRLIFLPKSNDKYCVGTKQLDLQNYSPDWSFYKNMQFGAIRSAEFLEWRYVKHPAFKYEVFTYGDIHQESVIVFRREKAFGDFDGIVFKIIEFFHPSSDAGKQNGLALLCFVANIAKEQNALYIDFVCSAKEYLDTAREFGFFEDLECKYPSRLTPVQYIEENFNIGIWSKDGIYPDVSDMYITRGDADADRLSSVDLIKKRGSV